MIEVRSITVASANVIPAKVSPPNPRSATNPRRSEALRNIRIERSVNIPNPVTNNIPILCPQSAMNPMRLSRKAIPPNTTIETIDISD
jgi:hypothetical protein